VVILSTILEILKNQCNFQIRKKFSLQTIGNNELLLSFSIIRNTRSLFASNKRFEALDTIRLFLIISVHIAHIYLFTATYGLVTLKKAILNTPKIFFDNRYVFVRNTPTIMDSFFTIRFESIIFFELKNIKKYFNFQNFHKLIHFIFFSGFITSYELLRKLDKTKGDFNYLHFIFHRWIKFSVPLLGSILFFYLFPLFGDGPVWEIGLKRVTLGCQNPKVLLKKFLYIDNFNDFHTYKVSKFEIKP
jgi:peptidoglycan/LPS O-acetylase OafA/YrhL